MKKQNINGIPAIKLKIKEEEKKKI